jgi:hypothetical protein
VRKWALFEKSGAKTLLTLAGGRETSTAKIKEVFLLLFAHKSTASLAYLPAF